jgi:hypothetical protein
MTSVEQRSASSLNRLAGLLAAASAVLAIVLLAAVALPLRAPAGPPAPVAADAEAESAAEEELEEEEWEVELEEEELEEEAFEASGTAGPTVLPPECTLRTADPSVAASPANGRLRLTLRYSTEFPARIGVEYWLKGSKGSLKLGATKHLLGKRGVLRLNNRLDDRELAKLRAARTFVVHLDVPAVDSHCKPYLTFRLGSKHRQGPRTTWSE